MIAAQAAEAGFSVEWGALGIAIFLLALNAFFVAAEFALLAARRSRLLFDDCQAQPFRNQGGFFLPFDLDLHAVAKLPFIVGALFDFQQGERASDFAAFADRVHEANLVEAVVDAHDLPLDGGQYIDGHGRQQ